MSKLDKLLIISLASWPRSGNTLLRAVLWHCFGLRSWSRYDESNSLLANKRRADLVGAIEGPRNLHDLLKIGDKQSVAPYKTHHRDAHKVQCPSIYVVRDGREACVSYWKYWENCRAPGDDAKRLIDFIQGDLHFGPWSNHVEHWLKAPQPCLLLKYEHLVDDIGSQIDAISEFIDMSPQSMELPDFEEFRESFPAFYRTGGEQTWPRYFNESLTRVFDRLHGKTMKKLGYYETPAEMES